MTDRWSGVGTPRALLREHGLPRGSVRLIRSYAVVGLPNEASEAVSMKLTCSGDKQLWTGSNLVRGRPAIRLGLRMLVTVPRSGVLDCVLRIVTASHTGQPGATARLVSGWVADYGGKGRAPFAEQYTLLATPRPLASVSGRPIQVGSDAGYVAAAGGGVIVQGDVYATECHVRDNFCPAGRYKRWGLARARVWLTATSDLCPAVVGKPAEVDIDSATHHHRVLATLTLSRTACGRWTFTIWAKAAPGSSNPFVVSTDGCYSDLAVFPGLPSASQPR